MTRHSPKLAVLKRFSAIAVAMLWLLPSYARMHRRLKRLVGRFRWFFHLLVSFDRQGYRDFQRRGLQVEVILSGAP